MFISVSSVFFLLKRKHKKNILSKQTLLQLVFEVELNYHLSFAILVINTY